MKEQRNIDPHHRAPLKEQRNSRECRSCSPRLIPHTMCGSPRLLRKEQRCSNRWQICSQTHTDAFSPLFPPENLSAWKNPMASAPSQLHALLPMVPHGPLYLVVHVSAWKREVGRGGGRGTGKVNRAPPMASSDNELSRTVNRSAGDFTIREVSATNLPPRTTGPKCV
jgi:hypothetical protein